MNRHLRAAAAHAGAGLLLVLTLGAAAWGPLRLLPELAAEVDGGDEA